MSGTVTSFWRLCRHDYTSDARDVTDARRDPIDNRHMTLSTTSFRSTFVALLIASATACGSSASTVSPSASAPSSATAASESTAPDVVADVPATDPTTTDSTVAEPEIIESVTVETVTLPTDATTVEPAAEELRDGVPTELGKTYAVIDPTTGTGFSLVSTVDGAYPFLVIGSASLSLDEAGNQGLLSVSALDRLRTFIDPTTDIMQIPPSDIEQVTEPVASDYLAWFSTLPGVIVGAIEETTVDGWPARTMTYEFGASPNGLPCDATSLAGCLFALWNPAGSAAFYTPNDTGALYEVVVDNARALIDVSTRPGAQEMFETVRFLLETEG